MSMRHGSFVTIDRSTPVVDIERAQKRLMHRKMVEERGEVAFYGPSNEDFVVVGEAPGMTEVQQGKPFVGQSGTLLRELMKRVGLKPERVLWTNCVGFWPKDENIKTRPPTDDEMRGRRSELLEELELGSSHKVLLVGATALRAFRPDLKLGTVHGQVFVWNGRYLVMPIYHPAAALRDGFLIKVIERDLERWWDLVELDVWEYARWARWLGQKCVKCQDSMTMFDLDGVPYCRKHWDNGKAMARARKHWGHSFSGEQLRLLEEPSESQPPAEGARDAKV